MLRLLLALMLPAAYADMRADETNNASIQHNLTEHTITIHEKQSKEQSKDLLRRESLTAGSIRATIPAHARMPSLSQGSRAKYMPARNLAQNYVGMPGKPPQEYAQAGFVSPNNVPIANAANAALSQREVLNGVPGPPGPPGPPGEAGPSGVPGPSGIPGPAGPQPYPVSAVPGMNDPPMQIPQTTNGQTTGTTGATGATGQTTVANGQITNGQTTVTTGQTTGATGATGATGQTTGQITQSTPANGGNTGYAVPGDTVAVPGLPGPPGPPGPPGDVRMIPAPGGSPGPSSSPGYAGAAAAPPGPQGPPGPPGTPGAPGPAFTVPQSYMLPPQSYGTPFGGGDYENQIDSQLKDGELGGNDVDEEDKEAEMKGPPPPYVSNSGHWILDPVDEEMVFMNNAGASQGILDDDPDKVRHPDPKMAEEVSVSHGKTSGFNKNGINNMETLQESEHAAGGWQWSGDPMAEPSFNPVNGDTPGATKWFRAQWENATTHGKSAWMPDILHDSTGGTISEYFGPFRVNYRSHTLELADWNLHVGSVQRKPGTGNVIVGLENYYMDGTNSFIAGDHNIVHGDGNTIFGGMDNIAEGAGNTIVGGQKSLDEAHHGGVILGGYHNMAPSDDAVVGGGNSNDAAAPDSDIIGGADNVASGTMSAISGGIDGATPGWLASGLGGDSNVASGPESVIGGGTGGNSDQQYGLENGQLPTSMMKAEPEEMSLDDIIASQKDLQQGEAAANSEQTVVGAEPGGGSGH